MKLLFFSPFSVIWQHAFPEALIARTLQNFSHEIIYVTCNKLYHKMCIGMGIYKVDSRSNETEKKAVCQLCVGRKKILTDYLKVKSLELTDFISDEEKTVINHKLEKLPRSEWIDLREEDIAVGKIALYIVLLKYKKLADSFSDEEWSEYRIELQYVLYTLCAMRKIIEQEKPDGVFIYNSFYPVNRVVTLMAEKLGIQPYWLHAGNILSNRLQTLNIGKGHHYDILNNILEHWQSKFKNLPALPKDIFRVRDHIVELIRGNNIFVYSSPDNFELDVLKYYGINQEQKMIVAVLSSHDERIGVETIGVLPKQQGLIFSNQTMWLQCLIEYVKNKKDVFLLIRVHPREFPNRRDNILSEYAKSLLKILSVLPPNVKINWPSDNISLYHLAKFMDVCLHAGSSVGKEMALLGIPVINYMKTGISYPFDLSLFAESKPAYFTCLDTALQTGWSIDFARRAFRWCAFEFVTATFNLSDKCKMTENEKISFFSRVMRKIASKFDPHFKEKRDCKRAEKPLQEAYQIHEIVKNMHVSKVDILLENFEPNGDIERELQTIRKVHKELINLLYSKHETYNRATLKDKMMP